MAEAVRRAAPRLKSLARRALPARLYRLYRRVRVGRLIAGFENRTVEHVYAGRRLLIRLEDPMAAAWYDRDLDDPPDIRFLRRHGLREGATVLNVGAHQGVVALLLADAVGPTGRVVAVEPVAHNARLAATNMDLNAARNVTVVRAAVTARSGRAPVEFELNSRVAGAGGWGTEEVRAVTVDELSSLYGAPDVLTIDVEGFELEVLKGAAATLRTARPTLLVEVHVGTGLEAAGASLEDLLSLLTGHGYKLWMLPEAEAGTEFEPLADARPEGRFFLAGVAGA